MALPFLLNRQVILLEQDIDGVRERALALFAGRARRTIGLEKDVCVFITSNEDVRRLNLRHRQKNKATDVLSFPPVSKDFSGDIAISWEIAAGNAAILGHSVEDELKILILHGLLHLAGHDHERDNGEMETRELALRRQFKLPAGLIERTRTGAGSRVPGSSLRLVRVGRRRKAAR